MRPLEWKVMERDTVAAPVLPDRRGYRLLLPRPVLVENIPAKQSDTIPLFRSRKRRVPPMEITFELNLLSQRFHLS